MSNITERVQIMDIYNNCGAFQGPQELQMGRKRGRKGVKNTKSIILKQYVVIEVLKLYQMVIKGGI